MKTFRFVQGHEPNDPCFCSELAEYDLPLYICSELVYDDERFGRATEELIVKVLDK